MQNAPPKHNHAGSVASMEAVPRMCAGMQAAPPKHNHAVSVVSMLGKHGGDARSRCQHPACTTRAQTRGLCFRHGGRTYTQPYQAPDCAAPVLAHGLCSKHGRRLLCPEPGCFESESQEAGARSTTLHMTLHSTRTETSVCLREENLNLLCIVLR
jgi:hypothetical protein